MSSTKPTRPGLPQAQHQDHQQEAEKCSIQGILCNLCWSMPALHGIPSQPTRHRKKSRDGQQDGWNRPTEDYCVWMPCKNNCFGQPHLDIALLQIFLLNVHTHTHTHIHYITSMWRKQCQCKQNHLCFKESTDLASYFFHSKSVYIKKFSLALLQSSVVCWAENKFK